MHHDGRVEYVLFLILTVLDAFQDGVAFRWRKGTSFFCGEVNVVFPPRSFEMGKVTF